MSNGGSQGSGGGGGSGVGTIGGIVQLIQASGSKRRAINPFGAAQRAFATEQQINEIQGRIDTDIRLGNPANQFDLTLLENLLTRRERLERKFKKQVKRKPKIFTRAGIAAGTTFAQLIAAIAGGSRAQRTIAQFASPIFNPPPLPALSGGTSTMPFVVTPTASAPGEFGGFGNLLTSIVTAGGNIASSLLAPRTREPVRLPGFQQASLIPAIPGALGALRGLLPSLGGIGAGAVGGELADSLQNLFRSGGASSLDDTAAFTDPVPGSCRPKAHVKINPCTGKGIWFSPRGTPMLFSGDLATCKRVARVNKRVQKAMPSKHHHHRKAAKR